jgi:aminoglycoside phosphotransferase (APT) family kinase protein
MHALNIERADGTRWRVSLRRLREHDAAAEPRGLEYEFEVLRLLERVGVSAPRAIHLDAAGKHFGVPVLVMTFLPGKTYVAPAETAPWTEALAGALHCVHTITLDTADLSILKLSDTRGRIDDIAADSCDDSLAADVVEVLRAHCDRIEPMPPTLIHNDYWAGNTIWNRGRLTSIIDWTHARLGDPRNDVSECRGAPPFDHAAEVADQFLAAYERRLGRALPEFWFFDLLRAVAAYLYYEFWLEGTRDLRIELDPVATRQRLAAFLQQAIDASTALA